MKFLLALLWLAPVLAFLHAMPYPRVADPQKTPSALSLIPNATQLSTAEARVVKHVAANLERCTQRFTKGTAGPLFDVPGCFKAPNGPMFRTCRHDGSVMCFRPESAQLDAMLRGEPWTLHAVKDGKWENWRVYAIEASDGRILRTHEQGNQAWSEWRPGAVVVAGIGWLLVTVATLAVRARRRPVGEVHLPRSHSAGDPT